TSPRASASSSMPMPSRGPSASRPRSPSDDSSAPEPGEERMNRTSRDALLALGAAAAFALGRVTAPAMTPPAPSDLAGSIRAALGENDALERLARSTSLLERLDPETLPGVVAVYEKMIPFLEPWELDPLFSAWARFDPAGAIEHALAWPMWDMKEERRRAVR